MRVWNGGSGAILCEACRTMITDGPRVLRPAALQTGHVSEGLRMHYCSPEHAPPGAHAVPMFASTPSDVEQEARDEAIEGPVEAKKRRDEPPYAFEIEAPSDGSIRVVAYGGTLAEPLYLPRVERAPASLRGAVAAAVAADPEAVTYDAAGLRWDTRASAQRAVEAARAVPARGTAPHIFKETS